MENAVESAPEEYLTRLGKAGEGPHDIAIAALMLAALDHPGRDLKSYRSHLDELGHAARAGMAFGVNAESTAKALAGIVFGHYGYDGDRLRYDDPANADMIQVIERRRGLPVALGILYMHAARAAQLEASGLFAPGHFLLRLTAKGEEVLIDPFNGGVTHERERFAGPYGAHPQFEADGSADALGPFAAVSDTEVLLRLLNNVKSRAMKARENTRGLEILRRMTLIAPKRAMLWLELAKLYETAGMLSLGRAAYETCLTLASQADGFRNEASLALQGLKRRLN